MSPFDLSRLANVRTCVARKACACAFPRPSANASAKLANNTINHNQRMTCGCDSKVLSRSTKSRIVETAAPTSHTNITGFRANVTGFSFLNDSAIARRTIARSKFEGILAAIISIPGTQSVSVAGVVAQYNFLLHGQALLQREH